MTKNPFINAFSASAYILAVVSLMYNGQKIFGPDDNSVLVPMGMLSLFVLSAGIMAYLFFYQPVMFYLEGKKEKGVNLFLQTLGVFAGVTVIIFFILFLLNRF